jgi:hypothetical protein
MHSVHKVSARARWCPPIYFFVHVFHIATAEQILIKLEVGCSYEAFQANLIPVGTNLKSCNEVKQTQ